MNTVYSQMVKNIEAGLKHLKDLLIEVRELRKDIEWWDKIRKYEEGQINPNVKRIGGTAYIEDKILVDKIKDLNKFLWDNLSIGVNSDVKTSGGVNYVDWPNKNYGPAIRELLKRSWEESN